MFTGIVEELGVITKVVQKKNLAVISVKGNKVCRGIKLGSSICVDGVCLTVTSMAKSILSFDVMTETLKATSIGALTKGRKVNLERALKANSRLDGHIVSGHVDTISMLKKIIKGENYLELQFSLNKVIDQYIVPKGSVCINGVSLTVGKVKKNYFSVYLIPTTEKETNLGLIKVDDVVNIEVDILARYIEKQVKR